MNKVYIAYEGSNKQGYQTYNILGVYTWEYQADDAVKNTITDTGVEVLRYTFDGMPTTCWFKRGIEYLIVGKVEEHTLID
jgi:hypothetical protein